MNKLTIKNKILDKKDVTYTIDPDLLRRLKKVLVEKEGYNLKKKSLWVNEAILILQKDKNYKEIVINADTSNPNDVVDKIKMELKERCTLADIRTEVIKEYPNINAPQSAIIRASIFNRLFIKC